MDSYTFIAHKGEVASLDSFLNTIKMLKRTAWNAFPCRHYFGMISIEQTEGGWMVGTAPVGTGAVTNTTFYAEADETQLALDIGRKMHPTLICGCASNDRCFTGACHVRP